MVMTQSSEATAAVFGAFDANIRLVEQAFSVRISNRSGGAGCGDVLVITGDAENTVFAERALNVLCRMAGAGETISENTVEYVIHSVQSDDEDGIGDLSDNVVTVTNRGKPIKPKTKGQASYVEKMKQHTVTFGIGPAGTGKTFLAVAMAVEALRSKRVDRILLTRPAVEAGERLGFLPGDLQSKIDPYLRPLYDALFEMLGAENTQRLMERGTIEIAPLAYMRGRTLDNSFIILDEAQNTTCEQMKMFLTRLGNGSCAVVMGDLTQTDLPTGQRSGLSVAVHILEGIDDIAVHRFENSDVVRNTLVRKMILAYDKYEKERANKRAGENPASFRENYEKTKIDH